MSLAPLGIKDHVESQSSPAYLRATVASILVFNVALALVFVPGLFDLPLTRALNSVADIYPVLDRLVLSLFSNEFFSGVILMALIWGAWFSSSEETAKARIAVGTLASWVAGMASRMLQYLLPTHPRPFYDPTLNFRSPHFVDSVPLNTWNSFPSDHVTVFAGLVTVLCVARLSGRWCVIGWVVLVEGTRTYMGAHYPTDLLGGAALGAAAVWASQAPALMRIGRILVSQALSRPALFYFCAFILSYEISILFFNLRSFASEMLSLRHTL